MSGSISFTDDVAYYGSPYFSGSTNGYNININGSRGSGNNSWAFSIQTANQINSYFLSYLTRPIDQTAYYSFRDRLYEGASFQDIINTIVYSQEETNDINAEFQSVLERTPISSDVTIRQNSMAAGKFCIIFDGRVLIVKSQSMTPTPTIRRYLEDLQPNITPRISIILVQIKLYQPTPPTLFRLYFCVS